MRRQIEARPVARLTLNRLSIARASSAIGLIALVVAILVYIGEHDVSNLVLIAAFIGIAGISLWTVLAPGDLQVMVSGRQARYGSNSLVSIILVIGIVAIIFSVVSQMTITADLTAEGYYSLKSFAAPIVKSIDTPIIITAFYTTARLNDESADTPVLHMFADAAPDKVKVNVIDPDENPAAAQLFGLNTSFGVYVSKTDAQGQPDIKNTVQMPCPMQQVDITKCYANERWIAQAIAQLEARNKYKILFTVGHNELDTDITNKGDAYAIRSEMQDVGIITDTLDLRNANIPPGTSAIVILQPKGDFRQDEVDKLAVYMAQGGKLIVMANPAFNGAIHFMVSPDSPMSKYLWSTWGIRPQNDIVYDPASAVGDYYRIEAQKYSTTSSIPKKDASTYLRPLFVISQSWELASTAPQNVQLEPFYMSSNKSYGKTNILAVAQNLHPEQLPQEKGDLQGPLVLAASAQNTVTNARLIVVGDASWVVNEVVSSYDGNDLWRNMIDYMTSFLTQITVDPIIAQSPIITTTGTLNIVLWITLILMPGVVLALGTFVMWDRLRK